MKLKLLRERERELESEWKTVESLEFVPGEKRSEKNKCLLKCRPFEFCAHAAWARATHFDHTNIFLLLHPNERLVEKTLSY